jgi:uncharacterized protein YqeY
MQEWERGEQREEKAEEEEKEIVIIQKLMPIKRINGRHAFSCHQFKSKRH